MQGDGTATIQKQVAPQVEVSASVDTKTSFAHQQNGIPFIRDVKVANVSAEKINDVELVMTCDPLFAAKKTIVLQRLEPGGSFGSEALDVSLSGEYLGRVHEATAARVSIEALSGGVVLGSFTAPIQLLAYDEWAGLASLPEILAAFSQPNHPAVERILRSASQLLGTSGKQSSLEGYQSRDRNRVWEISSAIYSAIAGLRLTYCNPPASFEHTGQKIRTPDRILESRLATCLDLCTLFSSSLEQAGLHPIILLKKGHAFAGVWLTEEQFATATVEDLQVVRKRSKLGELVAFETTLLTGEHPVTFEQAVERAGTYLTQEGDFELAVDIHRARLERIFPLPIRTQTGEIATQETPAPSSNGSLPISTPALVNDEQAEAGGSSAQTESPVARLDRWKRKLLDLSLRNRLLNFRTSKSTVPVLCSNPAVLEDTLSAGEKLHFRSISSVINSNDPRNQGVLQARYRTDALKGVLEEALAHRELYSDLAELELNGRLTEIYRSARTAFEEGGANTLFLAFGFLSWTETATSEKKYRAPLILVPVVLERKSVQQNFSLGIHDDEARVNSSLLEMLRQDFELDVPGVDPLPTDDSGINVNLVWQRFRRAIKDIPGWEVEEDVFLGLFSFAKYLMWKDLEDRTEDLKRSPVVKHLLDYPGEAFPDQGEFPEPETLDHKRHPAMTFAPLVADSSQLAAVFAAEDGKSFVLDGPPGTGKSQTITNIIAQCLASGKTVLFVSEKMAALEVVQRRLKQIGLEHFCLQLHSAKAKKTDVIEHLGSTWNSARLETAVDWQQEADRLAKLRDDLNEYVRELHRKYPNGLTPFQATAKVIEGKGLPTCEFSWKGAGLHDQPQRYGLCEIVDTLAIRANQVGDIAQCAFGGITAQDWSPSWEKEFRQLSANLCSAAEELGAASTQTSDIIGIPQRPFSWKQLHALDALAALLLESAGIPAAAVVLLSTPTFRTQCLSAADHLKRRNSIWAGLDGRYDESATELSLPQLLGDVRASRQDWWPKSWLRIRQVRKVLATSSLGLVPNSAQDLERDLTALITTAEEERHIERLGADLAPALGPCWKGKKTSSDELRRLAEWGKRFEEALILAREAFSDATPELAVVLRTLLENNPDAFRPEGSVSPKLLRFREALNRFNDSLTSFGTRVPFDKAIVIGPEKAAGAVATLSARVRRWLADSPGLRSWCSWNEVQSRASTAGLKPLIELMQDKDFAGQELGAIFDYNYCRWWLGEVLDSVPVLCRFVSQEHERKIDTFAKADERFSVLTREYLTGMLSQRIPRAHVEPGSSSELGLLAREMNKKSRHMPLRMLIQKMPTVLSRLTPCLMMSPMSVAQYLDAAHPLFDVVIFDEASQIPVWDAIGAIARGRQLVVAGDEKQLPPTNFFNRTIDPENGEGDDTEIEELESILDECNAIKLAPQHLKWHYRSRNESLIAFSNRKYYCNRLITFPSPVTRDAAVKLHAVNGVYDRSASRTNRMEAEKVVEFVVAHLKAQHRKTDNGDWQTIGIVTFNAQQQMLIEDLLDAERQKNPELEPYFSKDAAEYVLVKNLENVQGDERDVMVFSITYGQDASGKRSTNFGPLNRQGGERRLNVAITRARVGLHVFTSFGPEQIDLSKTRSQGVADLKHFLQYAQRGPRALSEAASIPGEETESIFEQQVCDMLCAKGWTVHPQVGCSGYRIDLGVVDPRTPGRYLLGIECDGAMYHRAATARDRDRLRSMVLRGLGWKLHRIWSTDWWANPERELEKVHQVITKLLEEREGASEPAETEAPPSATGLQKGEEPRATAQYASLAEPHEPESLPATGMLAPMKPWQPAAYKQAKLMAIAASDQFYCDSADAVIRSAILRVIDTEGPVAADVLVKRVSDFWGFARAGNRIRERILKLVPRTVAKTTEVGNVFFWPEGASAGTYTGFRINSENAEPLRDIDDICKQELANLLLYVIKQHAGVSEEQAIRDACRLLGVRRVTEKVSDRLRLVLRKMIKSEVITINGESLV